MATTVGTKHTIADELSTAHIQTVNDWVSSALGDSSNNDNKNDETIAPSSTFIPIIHEKKLSIE